MKNFKSFLSKPKEEETFSAREGKFPNQINNIKIDKNQTIPQFTENQKLAKENPFEKHASKKTSAGIIIKEPDSRIWLVKPKNGFGGYNYTFPKGTHEANSPSLQHTAVKETREETGLHAIPTHVLGDYEKTTSKTRYYVGNRIGGNPTHHDWETESVHLVTPEKAKTLLNHPIDQKILKDYVDKFHNEK